MVWDGELLNYICDACVFMNAVYLNGCNFFFSTIEIIYKYIMEDNEYNVNMYQVNQDLKIRIYLLVCSRCMMCYGICYIY